ncbi:MAG: hypothetical protein AAF762_09910 [Pseudomonadota bacterium]
MTLIPDRAAAGAPFADFVPAGHAIRILTGANIQQAGEDVVAGATVLRGGARPGPLEGARLAATGVTEVSILHPLRIGALSSGDEIAAPGSTNDPRADLQCEPPDATRPS